MSEYAPEDKTLATSIFDAGPWLYGESERATAIEFLAQGIAAGRQANEREALEGGRLALHRDGTSVWTKVTPPDGIDESLWVPREEYNQLYEHCCAWQEVAEKERSKIVEALKDSKTIIEDEDGAPYSSQFLKNVAQAIECGEV